MQELNLIKMVLYCKYIYSIIIKNGMIVDLKRRIRAYIICMICINFK